jgi:hypothetical protein
MLDVVGGVLRHTERERGVLGDRDERVDLVVGGAPATVRLVHRDDPDEEALGVAQRHEQRVLRRPGVGVVARRDPRHVAIDAQPLPVELAARHEVGAAAGEALVEERHPCLARRALPYEGAHRLLRADDGRGEHVVERRPVDVHHDGAVPEQLPDRAADVLEDLLEVRLVADEGSALEHLAEASDRRQRGYLA